MPAVQSGLLADVADAVKIINFHLTPIAFDDKYQCQSSISAREEIGDALNTKSLVFRRGGN
jgi:hypothetical protein